MRRGGIGQHPLAHQLGRAIGIDRHGRIVLRARHLVGRAIDRGGRGKEEVRHARCDRGGDQRVGAERIVGIIIERLLEPISGTTIEPAKCMIAPIRSSAMRRSTSARSATDPLVKAARRRDQRAIAGRQIVEHRDRPARVEQARARRGCRYSRRRR